MNIVLKSFLDEVEAYLEKSGIPATTFGKRAVNAGGFVQRLRDGGDVTTRRMAAARKWMADNPPAPDV